MNNFYSISLHLLVMIVKSILIFSALIYNVVSQHDLDHNEMTTPGSVENCVTVHNCCERYDGECVLYCEPVIECPTTHTRENRCSGRINVIFVIFREKFFLLIFHENILVDTS